MSATVRTLFFVCHRNLLRIAEGAGKWRAAAGHACAALRADGSDPALWHRLARAALRLGRAGQARAALERALALEPRHRASADDLLDVLLVAGDTRACLAHTAAVLARWPAHAKARAVRAALLPGLSVSDAASFEEEEMPPIPEAAHAEVRALLELKAAQDAQCGAGHTEGPGTTAGRAPRPWVLQGGAVAGAWMPLVTQTLAVLRRERATGGRQLLVEVRMPAEGAGSTQPENEEVQHEKEKEPEDGERILTRKMSRLKEQEEEERSHSTPAIARHITELFDLIVPTAELLAQDDFPESVNADSSASDDGDSASAAKESEGNESSNNSNSNSAEAGAEVSAFLTQHASERVDLATFAADLHHALLHARSVAWSEALAVRALELHRCVAATAFVPPESTLVLAEVLADVAQSLRRRASTASASATRLAGDAAALADCVAAADTALDHTAVVRLEWLRYHFCTLASNLPDAAYHLSRTLLAIGLVGDGEDDDNSIVLNHCATDSIISRQTIEAKLASFSNSAGGDSSSSSPQSERTAQGQCTSPQEGNNNSSSSNAKTQTAQEVVAENEGVLRDRGAPQRLRRLEALEQAYGALGDAPSALECLAELLRASSTADSRGRASLRPLSAHLVRVGTRASECGKQTPSPQCTRRVLRALLGVLAQLERVGPAGGADGARAQCVFDAWMAAHAVAQHCLAPAWPRARAVPFLVRLHALLARAGACHLRSGAFLATLFDALTAFSRVPADVDDLALCAEESDTSDSSSSSSNEWFAEAGMGLSELEWLEAMACCAQCLDARWVVSSEVAAHTHEALPPPPPAVLRARLARLFFVLCWTRDNSAARRTLSALVPQLVAVFDPLHPRAQPHLPFVNKVTLLLDVVHPDDLPPPPPLEATEDGSSSSSSTSTPAFVTVEEFTTNNLAAVLAQWDFDERSAATAAAGSVALGAALADLSQHPRHAATWFSLARTYRQELYRFVASAATRDPDCFRGNNSTTEEGSGEETPEAREVAMRASAALNSVAECRVLGPDTAAERVPCLCERGIVLLWRGLYVRRARPAFLAAAAATFEAALADDPGEWVFHVLAGRAHEKLLSPWLHRVACGDSARSEKNQEETKKEEEEETEALKHASAALEHFRAASERTARLLRGRPAPEAQYALLHLQCKLTCWACECTKSNTSTTATTSVEKVLSLLLSEEERKEHSSPVEAAQSARTRELERLRRFCAASHTHAGACCTLARALLADATSASDAGAVVELLLAVVKPNSRALFYAAPRAAGPSDIADMLVLPDEPVRREQRALALYGAALAAAHATRELHDFWRQLAGRPARHAAARSAARAHLVRLVRAEVDGAAGGAEDGDSDPLGLLQVAWELHRTADAPDAALETLLVDAYARACPQPERPSLADVVAQCRLRWPETRRRGGGGPPSSAASGGGASSSRKG